MDTLVWRMEVTSVHQYLTGHQGLVKVVGSRSCQGSLQKAPSHGGGFSKASGQLRRKPRCLPGRSAMGQEG